MSNVFPTKSYKVSKQKNKEINKKKTALNFACEEALSNLKRFAHSFTKCTYSCFQDLGIILNSRDVDIILIHNTEKKRIGIKLLMVSPLTIRTCFAEEVKFEKLLRKVRKVLRLWR